MKRYFLFIIIIASSFVSFSQTKSYEELKTEKRNLENQIALLKAQLKQVESQMAQIKNGTSNIEIVGSGNDRMTATVGSGGAILRDKTSSTGNILATMKAGETITLYKEKFGLYVKASYNGKAGWVSYTSLNSNPELDKFMMSDNKSTASTVKNTTTSTTTITTYDVNDPKYKRLKKLYGHDRAVKILNKQVWKGMSHGMVVESLGQPSERKSVNTPEGLKEEWIYPNKTVYFLNGSVDSWK